MAIPTKFLLNRENTYEDLHDFEDKSFSSQQETSTPSDAEHCNNPVEK